MPPRGNRSGSGIRRRTGHGAAAARWHHPLLGLRVPPDAGRTQPGGVLAVGSWVSGEATSSLALWNIDTGQPVAPPLRLSGALDTVAFSPDGSQLAADVISPGGASFDLVLVNASTGAIERRFAAHPGPGPFTRFAPVFDQVVFSADGQRVSSVVSDTVGGAIATFDTATGTRVGLHAAATECHRRIGRSA